MSLDSKIQTRVEFSNVLNRAMTRTEEVARIDPSWSLLASIRVQLEFMKHCISSQQAPTPTERSRINLGVIAVRNLIESDEEYANWLMELDYAFKRWDLLKTV